MALHKFVHTHVSLTVLKQKIHSIVLTCSRNFSEKIVAENKLCLICHFLEGGEGNKMATTVLGVKSCLTLHSSPTISLSI